MVNTADEVAAAWHQRYVDDIFPRSEQMEQRLKEKLLASEHNAPGFEMAIRNMRAEADLYREENLELLGQEKTLALEYDEILGAQTVMWDGEEIPLTKLAPFALDVDRSTRERAWRVGIERQSQDRERLHDLWRRMLDVRIKMAANAGLADFREYKWRQLLRFDYRPETNLAFHDGIERAICPAVERLRRRRCETMGISSLRPWDARVNPYGDGAPLRPYRKLGGLLEKLGGIFGRLDPRLAEYFHDMVENRLLDLESREHKFTGGINYDMLASNKSFIIANFTGIDMDLTVLAHECGHAFNNYLSAAQPSMVRGLGCPSEFAEVASTAMELLIHPFLSLDEGGFYSATDAARARVNSLTDHLAAHEYIAMVDAFQHWAYTNAHDAYDPDRCDEKWLELNRRFSPSIDISGLEEEVAGTWRDILHIFQIPFYIIEYAMAGVAASFVAKGYAEDPANAIDGYVTALSYAGSLPLPELYAAVGAPFEFTAETLKPVAEFLENKLLQAEAQASP